MYVFAYGSLIWHPNFDYSRRFKAVLKGYRRDYSIIETHHRGDVDNHGLVLGIHEDLNFNTHGVLFHIDNSKWEKVYNYLKERENPDKDYYLEKMVIVDSDFGSFEALTFVSNQEANTFFNSDCLDSKASIIEKSNGLSGSNIDYFKNNFDCLEELNLLGDDDIHVSLSKIIGKSQ